MNQEQICFRFVSLNISHKLNESLVGAINKRHFGELISANWSENWRNQFQCARVGISIVREKKYNVFVNFDSGNKNRSPLCRRCLCTQWIKLRVYYVYVVRYINDSQWFERVQSKSTIRKIRIRHTHTHSQKNGNTPQRTYGLSI